MSKSTSNLSKVGLEASHHSVDNNCGEFVSKRLVLKIKKIQCYYNKSSVLALFPLYDNPAADSNVLQSEYHKIFTKTFMEKVGNRNEIVPDLKIVTLDLYDDEFIESIDALVNKEVSMNEAEIYGVRLNTNQRSVIIGRSFEDNVESNCIVRSLKVEDDFIIGLKTTYEYKYHSEVDAKIPTMTFIKIYTDRNNNRKNYFRETKSKFLKYFSFLTKLITFLLLIISFLISYYFFSQNIYKGVLILNPDNSSSSKLLHFPTKLHTDEHGFVHIKAETIDDAFFTVGIAQARDRLWQMDFMRRLARGKLSEVLGEKAVKIDKMMRNVGINQLAIKDTDFILNDEAHREVVEKIEKYIEAVNFYANKHFLPPEYQLLNVKFENWTLTDSLAIVRFVSYTLSLDYPLELFNAKIRSALGEEFYQLIQKVSYENFLHSNETVLSEKDLVKLGLSSKNNITKVPIDSGLKTSNNTSIPTSEVKVVKTEDTKEEENIIPPEMINTHASNSWVVSGNYTSTGKPILQNDPHLSNSAPSIHYLIKLYIKTENPGEQRIFVGSIFPGAPIIIFGNNNYLAWGFTTDNRDVSDICEEALDDESIDKAKFYYVGEEKRELRVVDEEIKVKGRESVRFKVKYTRNGPVMEEFIKELNILGVGYKFEKSNQQININKMNTDNLPNPNAVSLRIVNFSKENAINFHYKLMLSKKKEDFLPEIDRYHAALLALTWATVDGEIGYTPIGKIPIKENKESTFCKGYMPDHLSKDVITGFIPRNETPVLINPDKGYIVTANNRQFPPGYIHYSQSYAYFNRYKRISQLIDDIIEKKKFEVNDNFRILADVYDLNCEDMLPKLIKIIERNWNLIADSGNNKENLLIYLNMLKSFNCHFYKNSTAATLYSVFEYHLGKNLLLQNKENNVNKGFDDDMEVRGMLNIYNYWNFIWNLVSQIESEEKILELENCKYYKPFSNCEGYIVDTFELLDKFLIEGGYKISSHIKPWGDVHFHYYPHSFDNNNLLRKVFSRKTSTDGNRYTVKVSKNKFHDINNGPFTSAHSANLKMINDFTDITRPYIIIDLGNSGNVLTKFYDNLMEKCERNELIKIKDHSFNDDVHLLISFPEHNTLIIRNN